MFFFVLSKWNIYFFCRSRCGSIVFVFGFNTVKCFYCCFWTLNLECFWLVKVNICRCSTIGTCTKIQEQQLPWCRRFRKNCSKICQSWTLFSIGLDLLSPIDIVIPRNKQLCMPTDLAFAIPLGYYGRLASTSGLVVQFGVTIEAGVIDQDYQCAYSDLFWYIVFNEWVFILIYFHTLCLMNGFHLDLFSYRRNVKLKERCAISKVTEILMIKNA